MLEMAVPNESFTDLASDKELACQPWQAIAALDLKRRGLLERFFQLPLDAKDSESIQQNIQLLLESDQSLKNIIQSVQTKLAKNFSALGNNQRAVDAYSSNK